MNRQASSMARVLSKTLSRRFEARLGCRHSHTRRGAPEAELVELEASPSPSPSSEAEAEAARGVAKRLEDAIDLAMARLSEPEWAPFRPGTSYWAPPRPAGGLGAAGLVAFMKNSRAPPLPPHAGPRDGDERAAAAGSRGWPCSAYFVDGHFPGDAMSSKADADASEDEEN